jgi:AcrR family transcriptional regulator
MSTTTSSRLTKADRRAQLLDVAADLVLTKGIGSVTMERLAECAGVSKALVYLHFDNADSVLHELYDREITHLGSAIMAAVDSTAEPEAKLRVAVHTYFDVVNLRGSLFARLAAVPSANPVSPDEDRRLAHRFVADLFVTIFALPARRARIAAAMLLGALNGGIDAWAAGDLRRSEVEHAAVSVALHLADRPPGR